MAQQVKATAKPYDLSLVPRSHIVDGENRLPQVAFLYSHTFWHMPLPQNELINVNKYFKF